MTDTNTPRAGAGWRFERPHDGRTFAGVAAAIARRNDIGVGWVRLGFVFASFFGGVGVLLYVLGWLLIPNEGEPDAVATRYLGRLEGASSWVGVALIGLAVLILLGATDLVRAELVWAGALVLVGVLLYRGDLDRAPRRDTAPSSDDAEAAPPAASPLGEDAVDARLERQAVAAMPPPHAPSRPERPPRPVSALGRITTAVILITVGIVWLLDRADVLFPDPAHYTAIILGLIGLGLLVGTWFGRARGLIALGIITLPFFLFFSYVDVPWNSGWGERTFRPMVAEVAGLEYRLAGGQLTIDLGDLDFGDRNEIGVNADLGFGEMRVIVPADVSIVADAEVIGGQIDLLGSIGNGFTVDRSVEIDRAEDVLLLDLRVGFGELSVVQAAE